MFEVRTNLYFDPLGVIQGGNGEPNRTLALFEREEDAAVFAQWLDRLWMEAIHEWDYCSQSWKPLTEAQANARPGVAESDSLPEWALQTPAAG